MTSATTSDPAAHQQRDVQPDPTHERAQAVTLRLERALGFPFTGGNRLEVLRNGARIFPAMLRAIEEAEVSVELLTYVYWTGEVAEKFAETLANKAGSGVHVRVLLDAFGAKSIENRLIERMKRAGVVVRWFRPFDWRVWRNDNRTHRKVLVCDGEIAFTGGVGIAEEWDGDARNPSEWRDNHFRVIGPAVRLLAAAFWGNWAEADSESQQPYEPRWPPHETGDGTQLQVVPSTAAQAISAASLQMRAVLEMAHRRVRIQTPYFVLDDVFKPLLISKAREGVIVEIMLPGEHLDKRYDQLAGEIDFTELLEGGVHIYRYQKTMLHAKLVLIDDALACLGSCNFNQRSLRKDDEIVLNAYDEPLFRQLWQMYDDDLRECEAIKDARWRHRPFVTRLCEGLMQPFRPQF